MQTFLPHADFVKSAQCLDRARLGKQRVEAATLLQIEQGMQSGWSRHPCSRMWRGHGFWLAVYGLSMCVEWRARGYRDNLTAEFERYLSKTDHSAAPPWLGDERLHASHRSNLLRKMPEHYGALGWTESSDLPYFWPTPKQKELPR